jgi:hypothetical protein
MGLSIRAYARRRGVSHVAVLRAIKLGPLPLEGDGTIDPPKADASWERSTDPAGKPKAKPPTEKLRADRTIRSLPLRDFRSGAYNQAAFR